MPAIIAAVPTARSEARNVGPNDDNTMMKYYNTPPAVQTHGEVRPQIQKIIIWAGREDRVVLRCNAVVDEDDGEAGGRHASLNND